MTGTRMEFDGQWARAIAGVLLGFVLLVAVSASNGRALVAHAGASPLDHAAAIAGCLLAPRARGALARGQGGY